MASRPLILRPSDDAIDRCHIKQVACEIKQLARAGITFWYSAVLINAPAGGKEVDDIVLAWIRADVGEPIRNYHMRIHGKCGDTVLHAWSHYPGTEWPPHK